MRTITLTYDSTTRRLSADDLTGGTVVDNASTVLTVEGLPEGEASVLWGVQVRDEEGAYYPFSDLDDSGSAPIPGGVLRWCNGGRLPVALRILHDDGTVESSVNRVTLAVTVYPDSVDSVAEVMGDKVMMYGDSWAWQERWTYDKDAVAIWDGSLWLSLKDGNAGNEPAYDSEWWIMVDRDIPSDDLPLMDGTASPGESRRWSRGDHVHPTDTTRASVDALQAEAEERARQDQALHDRVDTMATAESLAEEVQARKDADAALGGRIDGEEQARAQADTALGVRIDGEASARQQADQAEAQARQEADQTLQQAIDAEEQARISADQTLQADIDTRALQTALDAEESARQQADSALQADVDSRIPRSLPSSIVQDVTVAQTPTAVTLTLDRVDPDTGAGADQVRSLPVASASQAGVMSSAQVTQLQQASGDIEMLKGQSARYTVHLDTETPTQEQLQAAYDAITPAPPSPPKDGTTLLDLTYDKEYTWFATSSQWVDRGQTVVSLATQASPGIVQGADADGKIYVEGDGTMSVKGWDAVKDGIANNASAIGTEASARQSGDAELQQQISAEASARQSADATLQQNINQKVPVIRRVNGKELSADITITKSDVGLGSVDNTSDLAKPISTATQQALDAKADASALTAEAAARQQADNALQADIDTKQATVTGGATTILTANLTANRALISSSAGKVAASAVTATELAYLDGVTSGIQAQLNAKVPKAWPTSDAGKFLAIASDGQVEAIASSVEVSFADIKGDATDNASLASALNAKVPTSRTVNGKALSANITLGKGDVGLGNVDNTSDLNKPISTATQNALNAKADDSDVVHKSGAETIGGLKTFTSNLKVTKSNPQLLLSSSEVSIDNPPTSWTRLSAIYDTDSSGKILHSISGGVNGSTVNLDIYIATLRAGELISDGFRLFATADRTFATCPDIPLTAASNEIINARTLNQWPSIVRTVGNQTISGTKTFTAYPIVTNSWALLSRNDNYTIGSDSTYTARHIRFVDANGDLMSSIRSEAAGNAADASRVNDTVISDYGPNGKVCNLRLRITDSGEAQALLTQPVADCKDDQIVTAGWVKARVHVSDTEPTASDGVDGDIWMVY